MLTYKTQFHLEEVKQLCVCFDPSQRRRGGISCSGPSSAGWEVQQGQVCGKLLEDITTEPDLMGGGYLLKIQPFVSLVKILRIMLS